MAKTRIFLADDHTLLRNTLRLFLETKGEHLEVVGEASTAAAAVEGILCLSPDIVLMEIGLPDWDGIIVTGQILRQLPQIKMIAVTMYTEQIYLLPFLQAGGFGYIHKSATDRDLLLAIERVRQNEIFLSAAGVQIMAGRYRSQGILEKQETAEIANKMEKTGKAEEVEGAEILPDILSDREKQVLRLISHGYGYREIGEKLFVSTSTVETYKNRISEKLQLQKKAALIEYAIRHKLL
ncbi:LuxR family transcriptional regulator [Desulfitobacterium hafniense]|uniref:Stage 0 sporulation protein A homolog n=1 Tax=Desulfitobacterium hafniense TaxID=49338 RepID=A0A0W1JKW4_DESHA|nr:response regulator transcription factor [Desulfitobacterium hafniense]KTE92426.1 LuxR family transcriptional regulator [Desulfitobacterium hafniense]